MAAGLEPDVLWLLSCLEHAAAGALGALGHPRSRTLPLLYVCLHRFFLLFRCLSSSAPGHLLNRIQFNAHSPVGRARCGVAWPWRERVIPRGWLTGAVPVASSSAHFSAQYRNFFHAASWFLLPLKNNEKTNDKYRKILIKIQNEI